MDRHQTTPILSSLMLKMIRVAVFYEMKSYNYLRVGKHCRHVVDRTVGNSRVLQEIQPVLGCVGAKPNIKN